VLPAPAAFSCMVGEYGDEFDVGGTAGSALLLPEDDGEDGDADGEGGGAYVAPRKRRNRGKKLDEGDWYAAAG
jgi:hypothetical protein